MSGQYLLQGREGALLLLLQGLDLLQQTASLQTQPSDLLKHLLILCLTKTAAKKMYMKDIWQQLLNENQDLQPRPGPVVVFLVAEEKETGTGARGTGQVEQGSGVEERVANPGSL